MTAQAPQDLACSPSITKIGGAEDFSGGMRTVVARVPGEGTASIVRASW